MNKTLMIVLSLLILAGMGGGSYWYVNKHCDYDLSDDVSDDEGEEEEEEE